MTRTAGLVLAAGEGRRFGGPKAPFVIEGERLVDRAVRVLAEAGCDPVVVVLGSWFGEISGADVVVNAGWSAGMGSSLRVGLAHLDEISDIERVVVSLVDLPGLTAEAVTRLMTSGADLAAACYDGDRGHPVLIGRGHWVGVSASAEGDRGARAYLADHEVALVEVGDVASGLDLDVAP